MHTAPGLCVLTALVIGLSGCDGPKVSFNGHTGVPLAELNLSGRPVRDLTLLGPDTVQIVRGDTTTVRVEGDAQAKAALRFVFSDGKLGIGRQPDALVGTGVATITITTPSVDHLTMAGSGTINSDRLAGNVTGVTVGGSGHVATTGIETTQLDVSVLGSGAFTGSGHADKLSLALAGSGDVDLTRLMAAGAAVDVAGSGKGDLTVKGRVTGSVAGSGEVMIHGTDQCGISVVGSGRITCTR